MRVVAVVPTHQRAEALRGTLRSLKAQTTPLEVLVALDNCTDHSADVCEEEGVAWFRTEGNRYKKSGAQNQALARLDLSSYDAVLMMDDDTVMDPHLVEVGVEILERRDGLGAVCSSALILPPHEGASPWELLLWHVQNAEYGTFNAHRIETRGRIMVVHGMCALFRTSALLEVLEHRGAFYMEGNMTEDYELTLTLKELGWGAQSSVRMLAWTEVPLSLRALWTQRTRWFRGGLDCLRRKGWNRATRRDIMSHAMFWVLLLVQFFVARDLLTGGSMVLSPLTFLCVGLAQANALYRLRYASRRTWVSWALCLSLVPDLLYTWFRIAQTLHAYRLSFSRTEQNW